MSLKVLIQFASCVAICPIASLAKLSLPIKRIIYANFSNHPQNKLSSQQFGFQMPRSCTIQLLSFSDKFFGWIDSNEKAYAIYLDLLGLPSNGPLLTTKPSAASQNRELFF